MEQEHVDNFGFSPPGDVRSVCDECYETIMKMIAEAGTKARRPSPAQDPGP